MLTWNPSADFVPACLKLQKQQLDKLEKFRQFIIKTIGEDEWNEICEEDCTGASPMRFSVYSVGVCDVVNVSCPGQLGVEYECSLTIDDDGECSEFRAEDLIVQQK